MFYTSPTFVTILSWRWRARLGNLCTASALHISTTCTGTARTFPNMSPCDRLMLKTHAQTNHMGGSEKFWFYWRTKTYRAGVHCLYHACSKEDGGLAVGSAVKCRKAIFAYVAKRKSSSCTLYVCWNRVKKKFFFDFESLVLRKFRKITAISHPCNHLHVIDWCWKLMLRPITSSNMSPCDRLMLKTHAQTNLGRVVSRKSTASHYPLLHTIPCFTLSTVNSDPLLHTIHCFTVIHCFTAIHCFTLPTASHYPLLHTIHSKQWSTASHYPLLHSDPLLHTTHCFTLSPASHYPQ